MQYHGVVRSAMLCVQRTRSPQRWREQHRALAAAHAGWCAELAESLPPGSDPEDRWLDERWFGHRRNETYHLLRADALGALPRARRDALQAADAGPAEVRRWARTLEQAGTDADSEPVREWGRRLLAALREHGEHGQGVAGVCTFLLREAGLTEPQRVLAYTPRGREHRKRDELDRSVADYDRALEVDATDIWLRTGRARTLGLVGRLAEAHADLDVALADHPDDGDALCLRGELLGLEGRWEEALAAEPGHESAHRHRGEALIVLGRYEEAAADVAATLAADPEDGFHQFDDALLARLTAGPQPAARWAAVGARMPADCATGADRAPCRLLCRTAAGDRAAGGWAAADAALAELASGAPYWLLLTDLTVNLGVPAAGPGTAEADRARIEGYLRVIGDLLRDLPGA